MKKILLVMMICVLLTGCSWFGIDGNFLNSRTLKAEDRMLLVTNKGGKDKTKRIVCAEPSPDALLAIGASGSIKLPEQYSGVEAAGSFAQALSELGERTAVIQLLRDGLYRACEAYMNGAIGEEEFRREVLIYYDDFAVALFAIEALTRQERSLAGVSAVTQAMTEGLHKTNNDSNSERSAEKDNQQGSEHNVQKQKQTHSNGQKSSSEDSGKASSSAEGKALGSQFSGLDNRAQVSKDVKDIAINYLNNQAVIAFLHILKDKPPEQLEEYLTVLGNNKTFQDFLKSKGWK